MPDDNVIRRRAIHEAAHVVADALQATPVYYTRVILCARDGNAAVSIASGSRVSGGYDYTLLAHRDAATQAILVLLAGPSASARIERSRPRRVDVTDYQYAEVHATGLSSFTGEPAASYINRGETAADEFVEKHWQQIETVGTRFFAERRGSRAEVDAATIAQALREAGIATPDRL